MTQALNDRDLEKVVGGRISKDEALTLRGEAEIVINGESGEVVRYTETAP